MRPRGHDPTTAIHGHGKAQAAVALVAGDAALLKPVLSAVCRVCLVLVDVEAAAIGRAAFAGTRRSHDHGFTVPGERQGAAESVFAGQFVAELRPTRGGVHVEDEVAYVRFFGVRRATGDAFAIAGNGHGRPEGAPLVASLRVAHRSTRRATRVTVKGLDDAPATLVTRRPTDQPVTVAGECHGCSKSVSSFRRVPSSRLHPAGSLPGRIARIDPIECRW